MNTPANYTALVELESGQSDTGPVQEYYRTIKGEHILLPEVIWGSRQRRAEDTTWALWPITPAPGPHKGGEHAALVQLLALLASDRRSFFWMFHIRETETSRRAPFGSFGEESAGPLPIGIATPESELRVAQLLITAALADLEEVTAIYVQAYREELQVTVLLGIATYDDELMEELLDREYDAQKAVPSPVLSFSYIPKVYENRRDIVHPGARLIYER